MSFKFEFKIDYGKLTALLDTFLKSHSDELTSIMGQCLVLQPSSGNNEPVPTLSQQPTQQPPIVTPLPVSTVTEKQPDQTIDNRPLIGDSMPEDPLQNLFSNNPNASTTRFQDRNNPHMKKGHMNT